MLTLFADLCRLNIFLMHNLSISSSLYIDPWYYYTKLQRSIPICWLMNYLKLMPFQSDNVPMWILSHSQLQLQLLYLSCSVYFYCWIQKNKWHLLGSFHDLFEKYHPHELSIPNSTPDNAAIDWVQFCFHWAF